MNDLGQFANIFENIALWRGVVPPGFMADFLGTLTAREFLQDIVQFAGARSVYRAALDAPAGLPIAPTIGDGGNGERWLEAVDCIIAALEAKDRFVMASLGAFYGYQAVSCHRAIELLNPMPCKLICIEPLAEKIAWIRRHMRDNGIDQDRQWLIQAAIGESNAPVLFPVGAATIGGHNCVSTNDISARKNYIQMLLAEHRCKQALSDILLRNSTGIVKDLIADSNFTAEIQFVSCVTLSDVLGPFDFVDYVESDIQQSEMSVFLPAMDVMRRKVRRLHIGTHGGDVHAALHRMFAESGWEIVFSYAPDGRHGSALGPFTTGDGVLTVRNPGL
jgi:hypothetical protein